MLKFSEFMFCLRLFFCSVVVCFITFSGYAQTYVFAELSGTPTLNTAGWNLNGNAFVGDTPGDADNFFNELILTNAWNTQSGGVFYSTPIDPSICSNWTVEFEYRIWGGSAADGIAFSFLDVPPTGFVSGGGVGIPGSANGLKVILDTWNNCGGPNPELQIYSGTGYFECAPGIVKVDNSAGNLGFVRSNSYQPVKITYNNGNVTLFVNNQQYLTANFPISFVGYMGFTASTGGANDQHSIKNVTIYTDQATSDAGSDVSFCPSESAQIGVPSNPNYVYSWSPPIGLSSVNSSSPTVTLSNSGTTSVTQMYTVSTSLASSPGVCPSTDSVLVTVHPDIQNEINISICENETYLFAGQNISLPGVYTNLLQTQYGCDSIVILNLDVNTIYFDTLNVAICQNESYTLGTQNLTSSGLYTEIFQSISGCDSSVSINLTVNPLPMLSCPDTLICKGDTAELIPIGAESYSWNPLIGDIGNNGLLICSPLSSAMVELTGIDSNSCESSINVNINVQDLPSIELIPSDYEICLGESVQLTAFGGTNYIWETPIFSNNSLENQVITPDTSTFIYLAGFDDLGCQNNDSMILVVYELPVLSITPAQSICLGESVLIEVSGANSYNWMPEGDGEDFQFAPSESFDLWITGTDLNNCSDSIQTSVIVHPNPEADITASPMLTTSDVPHITFENTSEGGDSFILSTGDGSYYDLFDSQIEHSYPYSEGDYVVELYVENEFGCSDSIEILIQIKGAEIYYVPNSFTPDGDEHNNTFQAVFTSGFDPSQYEMTIYNRWGEELIRITDSSEYWDGTYKGRKCAEGTYIYKIYYVIPDTNESKTLTGHVNLLR